MIDTEKTYREYVDSKAEPMEPVAAAILTLADVLQDIASYSVVDEATIDRPLTASLAEIADALQAIQTQRGTSP